jgi:transcriptional regulator with XRE-family HTH domain
MDDQGTIGGRLRALRRWRGMTQVQLAGLAGLSQGFLSMVEHGQCAIDRRSHIAGLAAALRVSETEIVGGPHLSADPIQSGAHGAVSALRTALQMNTLRSAVVEVGRVRPVRELVDLVTGSIHRQRRHDDYMAMGKVLPGVLDELHAHVADPKDEADQQLALRALVTACDYAMWICKGLSYPDLAYFAAFRGDEAARMLDDPVAVGQAAFPLVVSAPRGDGRLVLAMAENAANALEPHVRGEVGIQVLGMLTLNASLAAAAVLDTDGAEHWLGEAGKLAARVPDDPGTAWGTFSATNVALWRIGVGVELGQSGGTVREQAARVNEAKLDTVPERKAWFCTDVGRGLARDPKTRDEAVSWLQRAESLAPQRVRNDAKVRESVAVMLERAKAAAVGRELRGMAARMGIPH